MVREPDTIPETTGSTRPPTEAPAPVHPRRRRRYLLAALYAVPLVLAVAGTCSLPRPGLPPGASARDPATGLAVGAASARYQAGPVRRWLMGDGYREAWAAPVAVPVLALDTFAGGLTPLRRGGGNQTRGLHLRGGDGRMYVFRSTDKDQGGRGTLLGRATWGRVRQDQVSALHPAAVLVADGVMDAAGIPHAEPRLVRMPDDPRLGHFQRDFAGLLGIIEENPADGFDGAPRVEETDALETQREVAVDGRAYLNARLVDIYLGDWDRHEGQWRWALRTRPAGQSWEPIPRDRDYALADYGGVLPSLARAGDRKIVRFDGEYRDLAGLLVDARPLDERFLCPVPPATWDSVALALQRSLTDAAITRAVRQMPAEYVRLDGAELTATLRARRDNLPAAARRFREHLHADGCGRSTDKR